MRLDTTPDAPIDRRRKRVSLADIGSIPIHEPNVAAAQLAYLQQHRILALSEFEAIPKKKSEASYKSAHGAARKNRYADILPYDDTRVRLRGDEGYINANYVCFPNRNRPLMFICCQGPLPHTVDDMWFVDGVCMRVCVSVCIYREMLYLSIYVCLYVCVSAMCNTTNVACADGSRKILGVGNNPVDPHRGPGA